MATKWTNKPVTTGLVKVSSIDLVTDEGHHEIQLLLGDITALPVTQKVDFIMVSAYGAIYSKSPMQVTGALLHKLGINVGELSKNKAQDLRQNFSCWFSKPLEERHPYGRLICFEPSGTDLGDIGQIVGDVFRCMIPAFDNTPSSVITPILSTTILPDMLGYMLESIVNAAANWILNGLPLTCLKIVAYWPGEIEKAHKNPQLKILINLFNEQKIKWESRKIKWAEPKIKYDAFLSYSEDDKEYVTKIKEQLEKDKPGIRIFSEKHKHKPKQAWQQEIYDAMSSSLKVIPILTPNFMSSQECVEEFNIAMCCSRSMHRELLAPLYVKEIRQLPVYMQHIQYLDCTGDKDITTGCKRLFGSVLNRTISQIMGKKKTAEYDVFISYCHKDTEKADKFVEILKKAKPDVKIFYDKNELQIGVSWQQILYHAIDSSSVVVSLLSTNYMNSAVCTEEYNLALACHMSWGSEVELIPIMIEDVTEIPKGFTYVPAVDAVDAKSLENNYSQICSGIQQFLVNGTMDPNIFHDIRVKHNITMALCNQRRKYFQQTFEWWNKENPIKLKQKPDIPVYSTKPNKTSDSGDIDVFISCNQIDRHFGYGLKHIILEKSKKLSVHLDCDTETSQLTKLGNAKIVVAIISPGYFKASRENQEFHSALCRQRASSDKKILYVIQSSQLTPTPTFAHLIPCNFACHDSFWRSHLMRCNKSTSALPSKGTAALMAAAEHIIDTLSNQSGEEKRDILINIVSKVKDSSPQEMIPMQKKLLKKLQETSSET